MPGVPASGEGVGRWEGGGAEGKGGGYSCDETPRPHLCIFESELGRVVGPKRVAWIGAGPAVGTHPTAGKDPPRRPPNGPPRRVSLQARVTYFSSSCDESGLFIVWASLRR